MIRTTALVSTAAFAGLAVWATLEKMGEVSG
jgi:hypothetical protein